MIIDRWNTIFAFVRENREVTITDLAKKIDVSEATIRRDIKELVRRKYLIYKNGLIFIDEEAFSNISFGLKMDDSILVRNSIYNSAKERICKYAAGLISDNDYIYIDAGSTVLRIIPYLTAKNIMVITSSANSLVALMDAGINAYVVSGYLTVGSGGIYDNDYRCLENKKITKAFLGAGSIQKDGYYSGRIDSVLKQIIISKAEVSYVLCDSSKYNQSRFLRFANLKDAALITDSIPPFEADFNFTVV